VCVCVCCSANVLVSITNRIYTSGRENSLRKGVPLLRVFLAPLTFRHLALGSAGSGSGSFSVTSLALDTDRDGASASASA
jgi:hypothetical protein